MAVLGLEVQIDGSWRRAATLEFPREADGERGQCFFEYELEFLDSWLDSGRIDAAVSLTLPLDFGPVLRATWPRFLDDLRPMGSARRWWLNRFGLADEPRSDFRLLRDGTVAPIGNLRIAESIPPKDAAPQRFEVDAVIAREQGFIEWAADHGAQVGGATGAGGDSPKLLLRQDPDSRVWIDVWQDEPHSPAAHLLVKFPRGKSERDRVILRSEFVYYQALTRLGVSTISTHGMDLKEGPTGPSLWLPRFDVARRAGREVRLGVESVYSVMEASPGARLRHQDVLEALRRLVPPADWPGLLVEYIKRDVLNLIFGNSDNHGRNTSLLKTERAVSLSPIYDFAPMKMDPEGVARSTVWRDFERGGDVDWRGLLPTLGEHESQVRESLRDLAQKLVGLPQLLRELELPRETLEFPGLGFEQTEARLRQWGLL